MMKVKAVAEKTVLGRDRGGWGAVGMWMLNCLELVSGQQGAPRRPWLPVTKGGVGFSWWSSG